MKYLTRLLLLTVVSAILAVGVSSVFEYSEPLEGRSLVRWILFEMRRTEALQERTIVISHSLEAKRAIVADLLADRLTLRKAAEEFRVANQMVENDCDGLVAPYRVPQTEAGVCYQVIAWTKAELAAHPRQAERVSQQLEKELTSLPPSNEIIQ